MSKVVIAIDGPAGAGKSTVAKILAKDLGLTYLDTGAMYRCLALQALRKGVDPSDGIGAAQLLDEITISFGTGDPQPVLMNGEDVTHEIRQHEISELSSALSVHNRVRTALVQRQKEIVKQGGVVLEGRDATTVIAPEADVKVYMTASLEERAKRRHKELEAKGADSSYETIRRDVEQRDHRDITREESPLTVSKDAQVVETCGLNPQQVADKIKALVPSRV